VVSAIANCCSAKAVSEASNLMSESYESDDNQIRILTKR